MFIVKVLSFAANEILCSTLFSTGVVTTIVGSIGSTVVTVPTDLDKTPEDYNEKK